jgi:hypothetical protein
MIKGHECILTNQTATADATWAMATYTIYLFYRLFNDAFSSSDYIVLNERMIVNTELERMWKEAVMA